MKLFYCEHNSASLGIDTFLSVRQFIDLFCYKHNDLNFVYILQMCRLWCYIFNVLIIMQVY